jgi:transcriptional regulator with XRE-family HTH domain
MRATGSGRGLILQERVKRTILSSRLRKARREQGLSEDELGKRAGLAAQRVLDLEQSCCDIPAEEIRAVAGALEVRVDHLL